MQVIILRKRILVFTGILMVVVLSLVLALSISQGLGVVPRSGLTVVIDAGHGGMDGGAVGYSKKTKESDINLEIAQKLKNLLDKAEFNVIMTRSDKNGLYGSDKPGFKKRDMLARREIIQNSGADLVISIHLNTYLTHSRRGAQVFFDAESQDGKLAADLVQKQLNQNINTARAFEALRGDYYILNCSNITSVIVECGFLSNPEEEQLLTTFEYQEKLAYNIFAGIVAYFDNKMMLTFNEIKTVRYT